MASRVAEMRLLNRKRWDAHVAAREAQGIPLEPTGGALFNRSNPLGPNGNFQNPYVRTNDPDKRYVEKRGKLVFVDKLGRPQQGPKTEEERIELMRNWQDNQRNSKSYVPVYGYDFTSVNVASHRKYRIPNTSVVNKVGDLRLICCCNMRLTAAQWIWWLNLLCFLVHTTMVFVTLYLAYWRWDRSMWRDTDHVMVKIYRVTQVPTGEMIANNESKWSSGWNNRSIGGGNEFYLRDNSMDVNFATLTLSFFAISAVFHLWACIVGLFERFWFIYWRQLDDAFAWWRWAEYSLSASTMAMAIAISIGLREQSILALIWMAHFTTMWHGFLTEYISVPKAMVDTTSYKYPIGPTQFKEFHAKGRLHPTVNGKYKNGNTDYRSDNRALKLISQDQWELERPVYDINDTSTVLGVTGDYFIAAQRTNNYIRRMVPHVLGYFPMTAAWVVIITHLEWARHDISQISDRTIPNWVDAVIYGTIIIFWSFAVVQIIFQRLPPGFYWGTELLYCTLSLTAKLYLGIFLLINVIYVDGSVEEALAPASR